VHYGGNATNWPQYPYPAFRRRSCRATRPREAHGRHAPARGSDEGEAAEKEAGEKTSLNKGPSHSHPFYTLLGYLLILVFLLAIALLIGAILYRFVTVPGRIISVEAFEKWGGLAIFTTAAFSFVIQKSRTRWRSRTFWMILGAIFVVHFALLLAGFRYVRPWRDWYWLVICTVEALSIAMFLDWTFERFGKNHHSKGNAI
jgi:hypothetical protein